MIPEGGAKCFERKSLKVFSVELALGPLEKISREYLSRNTNTHLPQVLLLQVHRCCLASALILEEIQHRFNRLALSRGNFRWKKLRHVPRRLARHWTQAFYYSPKQKESRSRDASDRSLISIHCTRAAPCSDLLAID